MICAKLPPRLRAKVEFLMRTDEAGPTQRYALSVIQDARDMLMRAQDIADDAHDAGQVRTWQDHLWYATQTQERALAIAELSSAIAAYLYRQRWRGQS